MFLTSRFNLYYPLDDSVAVFNAVSGQWAAFANDQAEHLREQSIDLLSSECLQTAQRIGAVIPGERDERQWYQRCLHDIMKDRTTATYIWALTFRCNLTCPYCFEGERNVATEMDLAACQRLLAAVQRRAEQDGTKRLAIMLFGGEPLLKRAECLSILRTMHAWCQCRAIEFRGLISSNGVLLSPAVMREFTGCLHGAQLTLDGPRAIHDQLRVGRNRKPTYDKILAAVRLLVKAGVFVHLRLQVHNEDADRLGELVADLRNRGIVPNPLVRISAAMVRVNTWCQSCQGFSGYVQSGSDSEHRAIRTIERLVPTGRPAAQIIPCVMAHNQVCIDPAGDLFRCITDVGDPECRVGYLHPTDDRFVFTERMAEYEARDPTRWPQCEACAYLPLCGGGCPRRAFEMHGSFDGPACNESKLVLDTRIRALIQRERQVSKRAAVCV